MKNKATKVLSDVVHAFVSVKQILTPVKHPANYKFSQNYFK